MCMQHLRHQDCSTSCGYDTICSRPCFCQMANSQIAAGPATRLACKACAVNIAPQEAMLQCPAHPVGGRRGVSSPAELVPRIPNDLHDDSMDNQHRIP